MSEYEERWYCPTCQKTQVFLLGGSRTDGICIGDTPLGDEGCGNKYLLTALEKVAEEQGIFKGKIRRARRVRENE